MELIRYRTIDASTVAMELQEKLKLNWSDREKIEHYLRYKYTVVEFEKRKKSNFFFRLTAILYLICWCLLACFMPVKYIFTGRAYYKSDGLLMKGFEKWRKELFF